MDRGTKRIQGFESLLEKESVLVEVAHAGTLGEPG